MHWHESCATFFVHPWIVVEIKRVHIDADNERNFGQDFFFFSHEARRWKHTWRWLNNARTNYAISIGFR